MQSQIGNRILPTAFTLVELLVVVALIAVLLALLTPVLNRAVGQSLRAKRGANLCQFGVANPRYAQVRHSRYTEQWITKT